MHVPAPGTVILYSTPWCGYCRQLKNRLDRQGISYTEVDIDQTPDAAELVLRLNGGNRTVPTVLFSDGGALTNPSPAQVIARLRAAADRQDPATGRQVP